MVLKLIDETDVVLSLLLLSNSRISYRDLADKLSLSANAVHKIIQSLIDLGVIRKFTTKISLPALRAVIVIDRSTSSAPVVALLSI